MPERLAGMWSRLSGRLARRDWTRRGWLLAGALAVMVVLSFALAWVSDVYGWYSFFLALLLGGLLMWASWISLRRESPPSWLAWLALGAAAARLGAGVLWFVTLPVYGHGSLPEKAGYIMADSYERDLAAWKLAQSNRPLWSAFQNNKSADQYGGVLFSSALVYRWLGGAAHQPLLIIVFTAVFSSLGLLFTWAFARRAWGAAAAGLAAWFLACYPDAILLGSAQMREPFSIALAAASFYGLVYFGQDRTWRGLAWLLAPLLITLPLSPPMAALLLLALLLTALVQHRDKLFKRLASRGSRWPTLLIIGVALLASLLVLAGMWLALRQFAPAKITNPVEVIAWWLQKTSDWQMHLTRQSSGWMQKLFKITPDWAHLPLLVAYGVAQPFLPAAVVAASTSVLWTAVAIWRAAGWTLLLACLVYAALRAFLRSRDPLAQGLTLAVWLGILAAAFRGGGDLWDNPRYRAAFLPIQVALAAWAWAEQRRTPDPWLRRLLGAGACVLVCFLGWYMRRYNGFDWPVVDLFKTLGVGLACGGLLAYMDWVRLSHPLAEPGQ